MNEWQAAYTTVAEVAATLTGLLFVAVSFKLNLASEVERRWMLMVAKRSLLDFLAVLVVALLFLVPGASVLMIGWCILWLAIVRVSWHIRHWRRYRSFAELGMSLRDYLMPVLLTLVMFLAAAAILLDWNMALKLTYAMSICLLFGACQNAWRLLTH